MSKPSLAAVTLVLGGARSGKSAWAEGQALSSGLAPVCIAAGEAGAPDMAGRRERSGARWAVVEEPLELAQALADWARPDRVVLVDRLTLWLANLMDAGRDPELEGERLAEGLAGLGGPVLLVSDEVGLGLAPGDALALKGPDA